MDTPAKEVGGMLRDARMAKKQELSVIGKEIHLPIAYLQALEAGDWSQLPADVYARGYVKKYAEYLGYDPAVMIAKLHPAPPVADPIRTPVLHPHRKNINIQPFLLLLALVFAGIGLVALLSAPTPSRTSQKVKTIPSTLTHYLDNTPLTPFYRYSCLEAVRDEALWECYAELRAMADDISQHPLFYRIQP
jgi:cytoskeleton protein RodZ